MPPFCEAGSSLSDPGPWPACTSSTPAMATACSTAGLTPAPSWPKPAATTRWWVTLRSSPPTTCGVLRQRLRRGAVDFEPLLYTTFPAAHLMPRVILDVPPPRPYFPRWTYSSARSVRMTPTRSQEWTRMSAWISRTWTDPAGLAASGHAWGAFVADELVAIACSFFVGDHYEDIGVVTQPTQRGRGLSTACAAALCGDFTAGADAPAGRRPPTTRPVCAWPPNSASGMQRHDRLLVVGGPPS